MLVPARVGLSSYLCRVCTICVSLSRLGVGIHPTTVRGVEKGCERDSGVCFAANEEEHCAVCRG
jgi:hypothetical protein